MHSKKLHIQIEHVRDMLNQERKLKKTSLAKGKKNIRTNKQTNSNKQKQKEKNNTSSSATTAATTETKI